MPDKLPALSVLIELIGPDGETFINAGPPINVTIGNTIRVHLPAPVPAISLTFDKERTS